MHVIWLISILIGFSFLMPNIYGEKITQNLDGGMDVEITYSDEIVIGRDGILSILVKNNGWEDKQDISFQFSSQDNAIITKPSDQISIDKLTQGGSYGGKIDLLTGDDIAPGIHFLNLKYSHVLVVNNETPQSPIFHDIAIPITIKENANVMIHTKTPESISQD